MPAERPAAFDSEYRSIESAGGADSRREALGAEHLSSVAVEKAPECVFVPFLLGWHDETPWEQMDSQSAEPPKKLSARWPR